jgi:hypothetical protein
VGGAEEEPGTLEVGYGLAPDLMGRGLGPRFVGAILGFALEPSDEGSFLVMVRRPRA